jgi:PTS system nitrogen regulatory IIA component
MRISSFINPDLIIPELRSRDKEGVLVELADNIAGVFPHLSRDELVAVLREREKLGSTGIGEGFAIPHGKLRNLDRIIISFGRSRPGIPFDSMDGKPAYYFFVLVAPENSAGDHLKALAKISRFIKNSAFREELARAADREALEQVIRGQDDLT